MNESLGINIDLDLVSDYPNSVYLFALNKEKIAFNNTQGIVVMN